MKIKIILITVLTMFLMTACKKKSSVMDKATADKVFAAVITEAKTQGKKCNMGFMSAPIMEAAVKEAGISKSAYAAYIKTESGKTHRSEAIKNCAN